MKYLEKIHIYNLWGKKEIRIDFFDRVTFLTGYNGSGKSSILNIIFDTLNPKGHISKPTSKSRFWGATAVLSDGSTTSKAYFPLNDAMSSILNEYEEEISNDSVFSYSVLKKIKAKYESVIDAPVKKFSLYNNANLDDITILSDAPNTSCVPFIYQDDRKSLHNIKDSNIDFKNDYWGNYGCHLDERFCFIRDTLQIYESRVHKIFTEEVTKLTGKATKKNFMDLLSKHADTINAITELNETINNYFSSSGKEICRDSSGKIGLKITKTDEYIEWYELSRGEKTIIYLLVTVFLYKEQISVFLFDEPDISIHIEWQERLVKDFLSIAPQCQFIIATHSPALIMSGWLDKAITIDLQGAE